MHRGYFKFWRRLLYSDLWLSEKFTRGQAWVDLVGLANHKEGFIRVRGNRVKIERGMIGWSQVKLAERWGWSRGKTRRFLDELEMEQQIEQQKNAVTSLIKILNWDDYQGNGHQTVQQTDSRQNSRRYTNKNVKNDKNDKTSFLSDSTEYRLADYLWRHILKNNPSAKKPNLQSWCKPIDLMLRIDKRNADDIKAMIEWCQHDTFWMANILSTAKLRKQWDKLVMQRKRKEVSHPAPPKLQEVTREDIFAEPK